MSSSYSQKDSSAPEEGNNGIRAAARGGSAGAPASFASATSFDHDASSVAVDIYGWHKKMTTLVALSIAIIHLSKHLYLQAIRHPTKKMASTKDPTLHSLHQINNSSQRSRGGQVVNVLAHSHNVSLSYQDDNI